MNFKKAATGFAAAALLSVSFTSGIVTAQAVPVDGDTTVTLNDSACVIGVSGVSGAWDVDFGNWIFSSDTAGDGSNVAGWIPDTTATPAGTNSIGFTVTDTSTNRQADCQVTVEAGSPTSLTNFIPLTLNGDSGSSTPSTSTTPATLSITVVPPGNGGADEALTAVIPSVLQSNLPDGEYTSTITVTDNEYSIP